MAVNFLKQNDTIYKMSIENKDNPEIYNKLQELAYQMLSTKKLHICNYDIDVISHTLAGDMYLKIIEGHPFKHATNYIEKTYKRYVDTQCNPKELVDIDVVSSILLEKEYFSSFTEDISNIVIRVYLENIDSLINLLLKECQLKHDTLEYMNFKVSVLLSLLYGDIKLFHLDKSYKIYIRMFIINFFEKIKSDYR